MFVVLSEKGNTVVVRELLSGKRERGAQKLLLPLLSQQNTSIPLTRSFARFILFFSHGTLGLHLSRVELFKSPSLASPLPLPPAFSKKYKSFFGKFSRSPLRCKEE